MNVEEMGSALAATVTTPEGTTSEGEALSALTVAQLRERACALGLPGRSKMTKAALIEAIEAAEAATQAPVEAAPEAATPEGEAPAATVALGRRLWAAGGYFRKRGLIGPKTEGVLKAALKEVFMTTTALTPREMAALRIVYILLGVIKRLL